MQDAPAVRAYVGKYTYGWAWVLGTARVYGCIAPGSGSPGCAGASIAGACRGGEGAIPPLRSRRRLGL